MPQFEQPNFDGIEFTDKQLGVEPYGEDEILTTDQLLEELGPETQAAYTEIQKKRQEGEN